MRELRWLIPLVLFAPVLWSMASWWAWFFFSAPLIDPYTEAHAVTTLFSFIAGMLSVPVVADV